MRSVSIRLRVTPLCSSAASRPLEEAAEDTAAVGAATAAAILLATRMTAAATATLATAEEATAAAAAAMAATIDATIASTTIGEMTGETTETDLRRALTVCRLLLTHMDIRRQHHTARPMALHRIPLRTAMTERAHRRLLPMAPLEPTPPTPQLRPTPLLLLPLIPMAQAT